MQRRRKKAATAPAPAPVAGLVRMVDQPPSHLPAVLLDDLVPFPGPVMPLLLDQPLRREAVLAAKHNSGFLLLINRRPAATDSPIHLGEQVSLVEGALADADAELDDDAPAGEAASQDLPPLRDGPRVAAARRPPPPLQLGDLHEVGVVARLLKVVRLADDRLSALVHLMRRAQPVALLARAPYPSLRVMYPAATDDAAHPAVQALYRQVRVNLGAFFAAHPTVSDDTKGVAMGLERPAALADFVAQHLARDTRERLGFLADLDLVSRMRRALEVTLRELDLLTVGNRISQEIREKVEKHQRDFLLREQLKAIRVELGEEKDPAALALTELKDKLARAGLSAPARARADEELARLQLLPSEAPEYNIIRSYLEWIASLPWSCVTADTHDIARARAVLDADHFGLAEVKERIVEFLAVHQLNPGRQGALMCLSGPPGVGKTSLGQSIARALGRSFYRLSVGGMRDEAEIKGHRRTYVGALPGRILQGLRQVKAANPVFMIDELDKIGHDWRGDPSSALLEVLDPAQNRSFADHYLDLPFDLSRVMFIATVNVHADIPHALRDRLEIIELPGYIPEEKLEIAARYLVPRQRREHGLGGGQLRLGRPALRRIVSGYTREAGVRELERAIAKVCRKRALALVQGETTHRQVAQGDVEGLLGPLKVHDERLGQRLAPGIARGLAWTAAGGAVLTIEAVRMPGKGLVRATGCIEKVMQESSELAVAYVRAAARQLGLDPELFARTDLHLHFPAGAIPKDGPSAGITITTALISLLCGRPLAPRLAMTGEMTLRGEVLAVGGIREKVVAARADGVRTVILPARNRAEVAEVPEEVRRTMRFVFAQNYAEVLAAAFVGGTGQAHGRRSAAARAPSGLPVAAAPTRARRP